MKKTRKTTKQKPIAAPTAPKAAKVPAVSKKKSEQKTKAKKVSALDAAAHTSSS